MRLDPDDGTVRRTSGLRAQDFQPAFPHWKARNRRFNCSPVLAIEILAAIVIIVILLVRHA